MDYFRKYIWTLGIFVIFNEANVCENCLFENCVWMSKHRGLACHFQPARHETPASLCKSAGNGTDFEGITVRGTGRETGVNWLRQNHLAGIRARSLVLSNLNIHEVAVDAFVSTKDTLSSLDLSENALVSLPDLVFQNFSVLKMVDLSRNHFTVLPVVAVSSAPALTNLNIMANQIQSIDQIGMEALKNLQTLDISFNRIEHLHHTSFKSLTNLATLALVGNNFVCDCELGWLRQYKNCLCVLNFDNCTRHHAEKTVVDFPIAENCSHRQNNNAVECNQETIFDMCYDLFDTTEKNAGGKSEDGDSLFQGDFLDGYLGDYGEPDKDYENTDGFANDFRTPEDSASDVRSTADVINNPFETSFDDHISHFNILENMTVASQALRNLKQENVQRSKFTLELVICFVALAIVIISVLIVLTFKYNRRKRIFLRLRSARLDMSGSESMDDDAFQEQGMRESLFPEDHNAGRDEVNLTDV